MDGIGDLVGPDAVRQLALRCALAVDGKGLAGVSAQFVPDVDNGRFRPGREGVKRFYDQSLGPCRLRHSSSTRSTSFGTLPARCSPTLHRPGHLITP